MTDLTIPGAAIRADGLDRLLIVMARYGCPRVCMIGAGWRCSVEMNTNTTGTVFTVSSEFDMPSPLVAAIQCNQRIEVALKQLTGARDA